jgi:hypothetical protein
MLKLVMPVLVAEGKAGLIHHGTNCFPRSGSTVLACSSTSRQNYSSRKFNFANRLNESVCPLFHWNSGTEEEFEV